MLLLRDRLQTRSQQCTSSAESAESPQATNSMTQLPLLPFPTGVLKFSIMRSTQCSAVLLGAHAYRRAPFGLYSSPAHRQRNLSATDSALRDNVRQNVWSIL